MDKIDLNSLSDEELKCLYTEISNSELIFDIKQLATKILINSA